MSAPTCRACGAEIAKKPKWSRAHYATRLYCNPGCQDAGRPDITTDYEVDERGCWIWQGRIDRNGYGKAYDPTMPPGRRVDWAHRVSYRRHRGEIPGRMQLDHTCQNTRCVNPDHLDVVTVAEHAARTMARLGKDDLHAKAADLRRLGLTYGEIADAMGMAGRGGAKDAVEAAIRKGLVDPDTLPSVNRLTDEDREDVRALYALGVPQAEIAAWYGIDSSAISRACSGSRGGHGGGEAA